ncbi:MAG: UDP-N-acetylglucosamine--N-acetylmuramyl-(pentapeptide) pyrophosphoryl-undecaprenol N-acetylglucosamine transferase [Propionibacteriaceae bacterium]
MTAPGRPVSVVLAGGGSAGHTSPLIATAEQLRTLRPDVMLTAVGTARGLETHTVPAAGLALELIPPVPMPRKPGADLLRVPGRLRTAVRAAGVILAAHRADVVLGFGGYVSTPVYLAARRAGVPIVLHEQNALPGLANKLAARLTHEVATTFPGTPLPHGRTIGLPLRSAITGLGHDEHDRAALRAEARAHFGLHPDRPVLLVTGGSQGAQQINSAVTGARTRLLRCGIQVLHVLGPRNLAADDGPTVDGDTGAVYVPLGYLDAIERAYAAADLMLGRAGASTVCEAAVVGLPTIFVPYPVGNGEQARNATAVVAAGGGMLVRDADCTADWLAAALRGLVDDPVRLEQMSAAMRSAATPDAARALAEWTLEVAGRKT